MVADLSFMKLAEIVSQPFHRLVIIGTAISDSEIKPISDGALGTYVCDAS